jgi:DNA-binding CsgD family transcriptional regulator
MFESPKASYFNINLPDTMKKNYMRNFSLTRREQDIVILLAKGMTRDEIDAKLFVSAETIKMHTKNLYKKLNAKNKIDALIKAKMI